MQRGHRGRRGEPKSVLGPRGGVPLILSGGLDPDNVGDGIRATRPYAVDTASGTERAPGRKDPAKLQAFFRAVRALDPEHSPA